MERRPGVSMKVSPETITCEICKNRLFQLSCFICKKKICEDCICDSKKYCLFCNQYSFDKNNTIIRIPVSTDSTKFIKIKNNRCCFM